MNIKQKQIIKMYRKLIIFEGSIEPFPIPENIVLELKNNANKNKLKSISQYISIVYANLFQKALSSNELVEITRCIESTSVEFSRVSSGQQSAGFLPIGKYTLFSSSVNRWLEPPANNIAWVFIDLTY